MSILFVFMCESNRYYYTVRYPLYRYISCLNIQIFFRSIIDILVDLEKYWIRFDDTFSINIILIILYTLFESALCVNFCGSITNSFTISFIFSWWDVRGPCKFIHACFFIWSAVVIMKWVQTIVGMFSLFLLFGKMLPKVLPLTSFGLLDVVFNRKDVDFLDVLLLIFTNLFIIVVLLLFWSWSIWFIGLLIFGGRSKFSGMFFCWTIKGARYLV